MKKIPLFDAHCDTAYECVRQGLPLRENSIHTDLVRGEKFGPRCQVYALYAPDNFVPSYHETMAYLKNQLKLNTDKVALCKTTDDIISCTGEGKAAALISAEGAELLDCSIENLVKAKADGVSSVNITWNYENALSGTNAEGADKGLTEKGFEFVKKCFEIGVTVDVSHISDPAFWDIASVATKPFIASHSNSRTICPHRRNLTDEQFKAIVACGGAAGINLYADFLGDNADVSTVIKHIDHFLKLGGEKNIALGADFDGCERLPKGINGVEDMDKLYNELIYLGYGQKLVDDIFWNNFMRVFSKTLVSETQE